MYPHERSLVKRFAGQPFALVGVNSDKDRNKIRQVVKDKSITWRSFWNGSKGMRGPISLHWNIKGWPTVYLLDAKGVIRHKNVATERLDDAIERLVGEAQRTKRAP
ncbi:MAG: hypothetical protein CMJ85_09765 [Planctomycetes bacterium]|jgi:hypothetical protein|nr:hypothetical protein [Planctomycetota bacterium]MDP6423896.1 thioredoxin-like domain-containing protein [Planctomycetota bacterium]